MFAFLKRPVREYSFAQRLVAGTFLGAVGLGIPALLLLLITIAGGRYQTSHGVQEDTLGTALLYPAGAALAGAVGLAFGPLVRRTWQAYVLGCLAALPMFALLTVADDPHGPQPYHIHWAFAVVCTMLVGGPAAVLIYREDASPRRKHEKRKPPRAAG